MSKKIIIDAHFPNETRVALLNAANVIEEIEYDTSHKQLLKGNIYLAKITRIEPSLQAAFVDYGSNKSGFLPFSEIHPDYYDTLVSDQNAYIEKLQEIFPPNITSEDLIEVAPSVFESSDKEIDIKSIENSIDAKISMDIDVSIEESEIEIISGQAVTPHNSKNYKIQEVIKKGQVLLVQITKEERGSKGVSLTSYISIAGKYCVLMPNASGQNGVSRKIADNSERSRLKGIISQFTDVESNSNFSIIIRTAGARKTSLEIKRDYEYLAKLWNKIREITLKSSAPCFIHAEDDIIKRVIRDMYDHNVKEVLIQDRAAYQSAIRFMQDILPAEVNKIVEYNNKTPIFTKFAVESQIVGLYQPIILLESGGYIVINPTEALISIDVNSGKATSERNIEETALKINVEAAREIARQIKLRDLSGLLVIDFIDMNELKNRKIVERSFKEFLSRDRARIQTNGISSFGLLELSRQRMRPSFLERHSSICSHCNGKGVVRADESNAMLILRTIENEIFNDKVSEVNVYTNLASTLHLLNQKREEINFIEKKYNLKLNFNVDHLATTDSYSIEKIKIPVVVKENINNSKQQSSENSPVENRQQTERKPEHRHNVDRKKPRIVVDKPEENKPSLENLAPEENAIVENKQPEHKQPERKRPEHKHAERKQPQKTEQPTIAKIESSVIVNSSDEQYLPNVVTEQENSQETAPVNTNIPTKRKRINRKPNAQRNHNHVKKDENSPIGNSDNTQNIVSKIEE